MTDEFFDHLEELLRARARSADRIESDAATFSQVDLVIELRQVARVVVEHCQQALVGGYDGWLELADMLRAAADACANEAVIEGGVSTGD